MFKDPANFNKMKGSFFKAFEIESTKCLEPTGCCTEELINSHSIQDSRILEKLALDNHVIQIVFDKSIVSNATPNTYAQPKCIFEPISIHKASVFKGLCNKHDTEIFKPIDVEELDLNNKTHVFLLTYRSVLKELSSSIKGAAMNQSFYLDKVKLGETPGDIPTIDGLIPVSMFMKAYDCNEYKILFDKDYLTKSYENIAWRYLIFENRATFATSAIFTPLEMATKEDEPERICVNVFPYNDKMYVLFSCRKEDEHYMNLYIDNIFNANEYYQKYLISKLVLRNCENTLISPLYFNTWSDTKKDTILQYFHNTFYSDMINYENENLYLF